MATDDRRPLVLGEFAWNTRRSEGKMTVTFGPDPFTSDNDDMWLRPDPDDPTKVIFVEPASDAIQSFITLGPDEYAIIHNPSTSFTTDHPNGTWKSGKGVEIPALAHGKKRVVSGGHFPIWPGQYIDRKPVHRLSTSEYLVALVEFADVDKEAPYYDLTARCASIRQAQVDETVATKEDAPATATSATGPDETGSQPEERHEQPAQEEEAVAAAEPVVTTFTVGQRIIIPGNLTPTYIPPSGIRVIIESELADNDEPPVSDVEVVKTSIATGLLKIENLRTWLQKAEIDEDYYPPIQEHYASLRRGGNPNTALLEAITTNFDRYQLKTVAEALRKATVKKAQPDLAIRKAVVLGPTEFCVLLDEDGSPKTKQGPGRVFPGPYDRIRTEGSRDGVYQAYHLRTDRSILLRVVTEISRDDLSQQLPAGITLPGDNPDFHKGDEVFIGGRDAYFVPSSAIEVINPTTRQPHIGNQHSDAYVQAIGVDQKSGVYVANVETGNVELIRGEKKLLLDPRKQAHVQRSISAAVWNLLIGRSEPHKIQPDGAMVKTPWALSVMVPNNEAMLVTSKGGRRVVIGPCTDLLEYEEGPEVLTLSGGTPKGSKPPTRTCFLRITGNRVSDEVEVVTADFVTVKFLVRYGVTFVGDTDEEREKWFNDTDYVSLLCENERSRLRAAARQLKLSELYAASSDFVRDTVLGKKEEGQEHRPNHTFSENNMCVTEVEVLDVSIPDPEVERSLASANRAIVQHEITAKEKQANLSAAEQQAAIDDKMKQLRLDEISRGEELATSEAESSERLRAAELERNRAKSEGEQKLATDLAKAKADSEKLLAEIRRATAEADAASELERKKQRQEAAAGFRTRLAEIERDVLKAYADADVDRLKAVQPGLIEAIEGLGDKQVLAQLASNLPEATGELGMALGIGGFTGLLQMLGQSPLAATLKSVGREVNAIEQQNTEDLKAGGAEE